MAEKKKFLYFDPNISSIREYGMSVMSGFTLTRLTEDPMK